MKIGSASATRAQGGVEAVERAIDLLNCFGTGESLTLAELARRSGFYKSTILRLALSLRMKGFLAREADGRFRLGPKLAELAARAREPVTLESILRSALRDLQTETSETASFYIRAGEERICLFRENSNLSLRHHLEEGTRQPLGRGAAGRVLIAADQHRRSGDARVLHSQGYLVSDGGRDPDLAAVAVPVRDPAGKLVGVLAVSGLRSRFPEERMARIGELLIEKAKAIQSKLAECAHSEVR